MIKLRRQSEACPFVAVPYRGATPLEPVELPDVAELEALPEGDPRRAELPGSPPMWIGLDPECHALPADAPRGGRAWLERSRRFVTRTPGAFLLADGRPALVYGAAADPGPDAAGGD